MPPCPLRPQKGRPVSRRTKCRVSPITHCWGECGCSNATRLLPQFGYPGVREGGLSIHVPYSSPSMAWYCCFDTQVPLDSGGSPSLRWTRHEAAERSHPGSPALIQLGQVIHVGSLLDNKVHLQPNQMWSVLNTDNVIVTISDPLIMIMIVICSLFNCTLLCSDSRRPLLNDATDATALQRLQRCDKPT